MEPTLEVFSSQIVVVGDFNPPIFSPHWLNRNGLLGDDDTEDAIANESLVVSPSVARLETDWFSLQVIQRQFVLLSKGPVTPQICDLATGIFTLIDQTPVTAIGLNFTAEYKMPSTDSWHKVGDALAPKNVWHEFFPENTHSVGLTELVIEIDPCRRGEEEKATGRRKRLSVSYSMNLKNGVHFFLNDHFPIIQEKKSKTSSANMAVSAISEHWDDSMNESKRVFGGVLNAITKKEN